MLLDLIERVVANHIEPFQMIREEDLEVVVMRLVQGGVDIVIISTGVGRVLDFEVLHKHEVFDHLDVLDLAVLAEEGTDGLLTRLVQAAHVEFAH